ncbi:uncharacterized protein LOC115216986 isoform X3 [Octopus sinensis]|uniref:Uncharacterized protein LOC115216986 isoform X3 n=1 Tax=Octopus sinensis TaxID=2607531 RepID=A0A6P7SVN3_9MOLL|nr:uncharacterized protein LOC115216986 isoform X3 [Octopus sinensis]
MIAGFQYMAMTITGAFHLGIGILCFIISMVGFSTKILQYQPTGHLSNVTSAAACIVSLWVIAVGIFGILAGHKSNTELQTRRMKITYMVLAILSASIFSIVGMSALSGHATWIAMFLVIKVIILYFVLDPLLCLRNLFWLLSLHPFAAAAHKQRVM